MSQRRPNAQDRYIADWIYNLGYGEYQISISDDSDVNPNGERFLGRARLKREGSLTIINGGKVIEIYPSVPPS